MSQNTLNGHKHPHLTLFHPALGWPRSQLEKPFEPPDTQPNCVGLLYYPQISTPVCKAQIRIQILQDALSTQDPYHLHHPRSFTVPKAILAMPMPSASSLPLTHLCKPGSPFLPNTVGLIHNIFFRIAICNQQFNIASFYHGKCFVSILL